jgi:hypothetical protein
MFKECMAYFVIFMMAMNSLLAASGGALLCLHEHNYGHLVAGEHSGHGDDCHGHEVESEHTHSYADESHSEQSMEEARHCFDIVIKSSDEPIRRICESFSVEKLVLVTHDYEQFEPASIARAFSELGLSPRPPPDRCGVLEQCVRKTVLRL